MEPVHFPAVLFHIRGGVLRPQVVGLAVAGQQRGAPAGIVAGKEVFGTGVPNVLRGDVVCKGLVPLDVEQGRLLFIKGREVVVAKRYLQLPCSIPRFFRHAYGVAHQVGVAVKEQQAQRAVRVIVGIEAAPLPLGALLAPAGDQLGHLEAVDEVGVDVSAPCWERPPG